MKSCDSTRARIDIFEMPKQRTAMYQSLVPGSEQFQRVEASIQAKCPLYALVDPAIAQHTLSA